MIIMISCNQEYLQIVILYKKEVVFDKDVIMKDTSFILPVQLAYLYGSLLDYLFSLSFQYHINFSNSAEKSYKDYQKEVLSEFPSFSEDLTTFSSYDLVNTIIKSPSQKLKEEQFR